MVYPAAQVYCPPNFRYDAKTDTCQRPDCPPGTTWQDGYYEGDKYVEGKCSDQSTGHSSSGIDSYLPPFLGLVGIVVILALLAR